MKERLETLAPKLRQAGDRVTGDYKNFFHDRAQMIEGWIRGYEFGDEGDPEYRAMVADEFEQLVSHM